MTSRPEPRPGSRRRPSRSRPRAPVAGAAVALVVAAGLLASTAASLAQTESGAGISAGSAVPLEPVTPGPGSTVESTRCRVRVDALATVVDNDSFAGQRRDGGYTSGVRIDAAGGVGSARGRLDDGIEALLGHGLDSDCLPTRGGTGLRSIYLVQAIYTPRDITEAAPQPRDRPWAGIVSLGRGWETVGLAGATVVARRVEVEVSVIGDASLARQSQRLAHRWISGDEPVGWDNQLRNRWGVGATYLERRRWALGRLGPVPVDLIGHAGATLGTVVTQGRAGAMLRFGDHDCTIATPGLVTQPIAIRTATTPGCDSPDDTTAAGPAGRHQFAFVGFDLRRVLRNELIEGRPRGGSNFAAAEPWVADLRIGYAIGRRDWTLSYALIRRTPDFNIDGERCCHETYAAISLGLTW